MNLIQSRVLSSSNFNFLLDDGVQFSQRWISSQLFWVDQAKKKQFKDICTYLIAINSCHKSTINELDNENNMVIIRKDFRYNINITVIGMVNIFKDLFDGYIGVSDEELKDIAKDFIKLCIFGDFNNLPNLDNFTPNIGVLITKLPNYISSFFDTEVKYPPKLVEIFNFADISITGNELSNLTLTVESVDYTVYNGDLADKFIMLAHNNFINTDLRGVNFMGYDLSGFDFSSADLQGANFSFANLTDTYFGSAILSNANLQFANLTRTAFSHAKLSWANFSFANLTETNFHCAEFNGAILDYTRIDSVIFDDQWNTFHNISFYGANIRNIDFSSLYLIEITFKQASLENVNFGYTEFNNVDFEGAILKIVNFSFSVFIDVNFKSIKRLIDVTFTGNQIVNANFGGTNFDAVNSVVFNSLYLRGMQPQIENIIRSIISIDRIYQDLRNSLIKEVFDYFRDIDLISVVKSLAEIIFNGDLDSVLELDIGRLFLNFANVNPYKFTHDQIVFFLIHCYSLEESNFYDFILQYNQFFIQLIQQASKLNLTEELQSLRTNLYIKYLLAFNILIKVESPQEQSRQLSFGYELSSNYIDSIGCVYSAEDLLGQMIFIESSSEKLLIVSIEYMDVFLYEKKIKCDVEWTHVVYIINGQIQRFGDINLSDIFGVFKIFQHEYEFNLQHCEFIKLIKLLNLQEFEHNFLKAIRKSNAPNVKYVDKDSQLKLGYIFQKYFVVNTEFPELTSEHVKNIIGIYGYSSASNLEKAKLLLVLSCIFTRYSSSVFFGRDSDSPEIIRCYAYGLFLSSAKYSKELTSEIFNDCKNRFFGILNAFTCADAIYTIILSLCKSFDDYHTNYVRLIPPQWR